MSANDANPALEPLRELVLIAFGPRQVVMDEFAAIPGITELASFGSWAARYRGEGGPIPGDVGVLVVGGGVDRELARNAIHEAADRAADACGAM